MRGLFAVLCGLTAAGAVQAAVVTKGVDYTIGDTKFHSTLVYDDASKALRPGLVMVPNWMGPNDAAIAKAKTIAGYDYVILLTDVYGVDLRPKNTDEAGKAAHAMYENLARLRERVNRGLDELKAQAKNAPIDVNRLGAIGFCFGGATVLELARTGAPIAAVVTFHGSLDTTMPAQPDTIKASILALNGADDSYTKPEVIAKFQKEMTDAHVDWQFVNFSGTVHCFAEPDANSPPGCLYNEKSAKRAFKMMHNFLDERFAGH